MDKYLKLIPKLSEDDFEELMRLHRLNLLCFDMYKEDKDERHLTLVRNEIKRIEKLFEKYE